jgi:hypothetical protein
VDAERSAVLDLKRAIADGGRLVLAPRCHVMKTSTGAVVIIPDKGAVQRYAGINEAAWALARRLV